MISRKDPAPVNRHEVLDGQLVEELGWPERNHQALFDMLDESADKLMAMENMLGLATAQLFSLLCCFRQDVEDFRAELTSPRERVELWSEISEPIYLLTKQIDTFVATADKLAQRRQQPKAVRQTKPRYGIGTLD